MTTVLIGNGAPMMQIDGRSVPAEHVNQSVTRIDMWEGFDDADNVAHTLSTKNDMGLVRIARHLDLRKHPQRYAIGVNEVDHIMAIHSAVSPEWVTSDDEEFAAALGDYFDCPVGEPVALLTTVGRDALHGQHIATAAQPAAFSYMAVSANTTAVSAASTTLPAEITTAGGGLLRAQGTVAHTATTNTSTLTKTFTANGSDSLPVVLAKIGVLNASSVGTLGYETLLNATATLTVSGDNVVITETVTAG